MDDFLTAVGLVLILEGAPYFIAPDRMRSWGVRMSEQSDSLLRNTGLIMMIIGLVVVYMIRG